MTKLSALRELEERLRRLKADYDAATAEGKADSQVLLAAFLSVHEVIEFINNMPGWQGLDFGLAKVTEALAEVESGRRPSWLTNPSPGRKPPSNRTVLLRAHCAAVMEFLMRNEHDREPAARFVFRGIPKPVAKLLAAHEGSHRTMTWRSIAGWRDNVTGPPIPELAHEQYRYQTTLIALEAAPGTVKHRATLLLNGLIRMAE